MSIYIIILFTFVTFCYFFTFSHYILIKDIFLFLIFFCFYLLFFIFYFLPHTILYKKKVAKNINRYVIFFIFFIFTIL